MILKHLYRYILSFTCFLCIEVTFVPILFKVRVVFFNCISQRKDISSTKRPEKEMNDAGSLRRTLGNAFSRAV